MIFGNDSRVNLFYQVTSIAFFDLGDAPPGCAGATLAPLPRLPHVRRAIHAGESAPRRGLPARRSTGFQGWVSHKGCQPTTPGPTWMPLVAATWKPILPCRFCDAVP